MISPWKWGWLNPSTMICTGPIAMRYPLRLIGLPVPPTSRRQVSGGQVSRSRLSSPSIQPRRRWRITRQGLVCPRPVGLVWRTSQISAARRTGGRGQRHRPRGMPPSRAGLGGRGEVGALGTPEATSSQPGNLRYASGPGRWVLLATVLGSAIASINATVVGIALPAIGRDFSTGLAALQWVVTAYTLTLAGLLLFAGALGDKYGRKRIFLTGVVWFAVASLLCGVAPDAPFLIAARAVQGIGAALLTPGSLAIIEASFAPADRGKAIGAWSFLGGWLIQAVSWRLIFVINLPIAALVVVVSLRHVPESRDPGATGRVDVTGGALI